LSEVRSPHLRGLRAARRAGARRRAARGALSLRRGAGQNVGCHVGWPARRWSPRAAAISVRAL